MLYHYTTLNTLRHIIEGKTLRATNCLQLNDENELKAGQEFFKQKIETEFSCQHHREVKNRLLKLVEHPISEIVGNVFSISFSEHCDSLYQWRAYTDPLEGGIAIGFDAIELKRNLRATASSRAGRRGKKDKDSVLLQCSYGSEMSSHDNALQEMISRHYSNIDLLLRQSPVADQKKNDEIIRNTIKMLREAICLRKDIAYAIEKEWRIILEVNDNETTMSGSKRPVRLNENMREYVELFFDPRTFIQEIVISPHGNPEIAKRLYGFYKKKKEISESCRIRRSEIKFRSGKY